LKHAALALALAAALPVAAPAAESALFALRLLK
jgi:hypothetical protein